MNENDFNTVEKEIMIRTLLQRIQVLEDLLAINQAQLDRYQSNELDYMDKTRQIKEVEALEKEFQDFLSTKI